MAERGLTAKQEEFCRCIALERLSQRQAYIKAYGQKGKTEKSVDELACKLLKNVKVISRVKELQETLINRTLWSKEEMINDLRDIAMECKAASVTGMDTDGNETIYTDTKARSVAVNAIKAAGEFLGYKAAEKVEADLNIVVEFNIPRPMRRKNEADD